MKWLRQLLGLKPNDWVPVWTEYGIWNSDLGGKYTCFYTIYYSSIRKQLRLITEGYKPKKHKMYFYAKQELIELTNQYRNEKN